MVANETMADNDDAPLDDKIIKRTQETLGKIIKAPPLTDKLLSRPPFRFLHDVVTAVMKATGFMKGLHPESDLKSDNVKEKEQKIAFLQKTIDFISFVLGHQLSTNPTKVVAGKEADKTNELLQAIAEAAAKKVDNDVMVKRFLSGEKSNEQPSNNAAQSKPAKAAPPAAKPPAQTQSQSKDREREKEKEKEKAREKPKENGERPSGRSQASDKTRQQSPKKREESPERPADTTNLKNRPREAGAAGRGNNRKPGEPGTDSEGEAGGDDGQANEQQPNRKLTRPPSARGRQPSGVQGSRSKPNESTDRAPNHPEPPGSAKPSKLATPDTTVKSKVVIQKAAKGDSDDEDEFVVREAGPGAAPLGAPDGTASALLGGNEDQHGALVQKIIDTTKALDNKAGTKTSKLSPAEEAALRRQREAVTREMEKLCAAVQASARLAAPLARLSELVQEDLDAMNTELNMWRAEHRKAVAQIAQTSNPQKQGGKQSAMAANSATNEALRGQLRELDSQLAEMAEAVAAVRGNCMRNEQRIAHMLSGNSGPNR